MGALYCCRVWLCGLPSSLCWPEVLDLSVQVSELIYGRLQQLLAGAEDTWGISMPWLPQRAQEVPGGV